MQWNEISQNVLKDYGLVGLLILCVFVFSGYTLHKVISFFMLQVQNKDKQIGSFTEALQQNTQAIDRLTYVLGGEMTNPKIKIAK